jgi:hypothetical protein
MVTEHGACRRCLDVTGDQFLVEAFPRSILALETRQKAARRPVVQELQLVPPAFAARLMGTVAQELITAVPLTANSNMALPAMPSKLQA